jgi:AcrR family transcriptional regulator
MAAALELFSERAAEDVSIDDVATAAGASRALVYHYFGGKQELYVAALRSAAEQLESRLRGAAGQQESRPRPQGGGPFHELALGLMRYFDFVEEHAAGFAALLRGGPANRSGEVGEIVDAVRQRLCRMVQLQLRVHEPSPVLRATLRSWIASVETAGLDWLERRDIDRATLEHMLVDHMVALLDVAARYDDEVGRILQVLGERPA